MKREEFFEGQQVTYVPVDYCSGEPARGMVKSISDKYDAAFVVYHCNGDWDNFRDYTAQLTSFESLREGWETN